MTPRPLTPLVTCEHGGNRVPRRYDQVFGGAEAALASHRGWDPGALPLARVLARRLGAPLRYSLTTRLLVDPNRSRGSDTLLSEFSRELPPAERGPLISRHHTRYRSRMAQWVEHTIAGGGCVVHLGVHTFTPELNGVVRDVDVGVLFDPDRGEEARFAHGLLAAVEGRAPGLRVRANEPYKGVDDGLTTAFRQRFPAATYLGIELEVNQQLLLGEASVRQEVTAAVVEGVVEALG